MFSTRNGMWQQVNNVERRWLLIRKDTGLDWVTPHTFRKTVATLISERVNAETACHQLGHSSPGHHPRVPHLQAGGRRRRRARPGGVGRRGSGRRPTHWVAAKAINRLPASSPSRQ